MKRWITSTENWNLFNHMDILELKNIIFNIKTFRYFEQTEEHWVSTRKHIKIS